MSSYLNTGNSVFTGFFRASCEAQYERNYQLVQYSISSYNVNKHSGKEKEG